MHDKIRLRNALTGGLRLILDSWSIWLLLAAANWFFIALQHRLLNPAITQLLPRIPHPDLTLVPAESYIVLIMEGTYQLANSSSFHRLLAAFIIVILIKALLKPFLNIIIFSPLAQPEPTVSYYLLWRQLSHRFPAFLAVTAIQWICVGLTITATGLLALFLAEDIWRTGSWFSFVLLLLLLLAGLFLVSWGFSAFTLWKAALAKGERLWPGVVLSLRTSFLERPLPCILLPMAFWLLSGILAAMIQMLLPWTPKLGVFVAAAWLPLPFLWLTYTLSGFLLRREQ